MTNHASFLAQRRFGSLDGLRAISILAVIWHHTSNTVLAHIGNQGVTLFFAISGFLITTLLLRERDRRGSIDLKAFYLRRSLRIFPLYYGTLLVYVLAVTLLERNTAEGREFFENLPYFATYTSNLFVHLDGRVIFYFAWSLAAEEQFYLLWPPILLLMGASAARAAIPLVLTIVVCVIGTVLDGRFLSAVPLAIVYGALLAVLLHTRRGYQWLYRILGHGWSPLLIVISLGFSLSAGTVPHYLSHLLWAMLVASCVIREQHVFSGVLSIKPIAYIGSISYGMYMLHMLSKNAVMKLLSTFALPGPDLAVFVLTFATATLVAGLSFKYYESFFLRWKRSYER